MNRFAFATVRGLWNGQTTGISTASGERPGGMSDIDIYRSLRLEAQHGLSRWVGSASKITVASFGIFPETVDASQYDQAMMTVEGWSNGKTPNSGGEAFVIIEGEMATAALYEHLYEEASRYCRRSSSRSVEYVSVGSFNLLQPGIVTTDQPPSQS